jgi:alpha-glucosidase (family GH31 glycosyl hydrolase)
LWTGDNQATFDDLTGSIATILALNIAGISFVGVDIPGFFGEP